MTSTVPKWVRHELTYVHRLAAFDTFSNLLVLFKNEPFVGRVITVDEEWVFYVDRKRGFVWVDKDDRMLQHPFPDLTFTLKKLFLLCGGVVKV